MKTKTLFFIILFSNSLYAQIQQNKAPKKLSKIRQADIESTKQLAPKLKKTRQYNVENAMQGGFFNPKQKKLRSTKKW